MSDHCPHCGANYLLVGKMHRCTGPQKASVNKPVNKQAQTAKEFIHTAPRKTSTEAFKRWRDRNRDKWRSYHTEYMRKYRAEKKANASA